MCLAEMRGIKAWSGLLLKSSAQAFHLSHSPTLELTLKPHSSLHPTHNLLVQNAFLYDLLCPRLWCHGFGRRRQPRCFGRPQQQRHLLRRQHLERQVRRDPPQVRLVLLPFERLSLQDAESFPKDSCKDSTCTQGLVVELAAAIDVATAACVDLKGFIGLGLASDIVDVIVVSLYSPSGSDAIGSQFVS